MKEKVLETIRKYKLIESGDKIILGVSGGPDSISMLNIIKDLKNEKKIECELIVAHLNHMIREEATDDEEYVKKYCEKNKIKCYTKRIDVKQYANNNKQGLEEAGRNLRYEFLEEIFEKEKAQKIAIAHNKNDKAETLIMNVLRGTGISGLKAITPKRQNKYIRPILEIERKEVEEYCEKNQLNPRIDKTNFINDCTRNKIRNIVIPYIRKEFNPNIVEALNRLSEVATEEDEYLNIVVTRIYDEVKIKEEEKHIILNLKEFNKQKEFIKKKIIIYTINKTVGNVQNIEKVNIDDILKLCSNNIGNKYLTPNKEIKILVNKGKIFFDAIV